MPIVVTMKIEDLGQINIYHLKCHTTSNSRDFEKRSLDINAMGY